MRSGLYRGMDRAALDWAYTPSSVVPADAVQESLRAWAVLSDAARAGLGRPRTLRYGPGLRELVDVFPAVAHQAVEGVPLLVYLHGGYWLEGSREDSAFLGTDLVPRGIAYAAVGYPLAPAADLDRIVDSCERAVELLLDRAPDLGVDPDRIHLCGLSAGAQLATMIATGRLAGRVRGVIAVSGIYDLEPLALGQLGAELGLDLVTAARNSPLHRLRAGLPPIVVAHGDQETDEFVRQSRDFVEAWRAAGNAAELVTERAHHFDIVNRCGDPASPLGRALLDQLG